MSHFKKKLAAFTAMLAFLSLSGAALADSYLGGNATTIKNTNNVDFNNSTDNLLNVNVNSGAHGAVGQVDWGKLNVGSGQQLNFGFSGLSQTIINRVLGGEASTFLGKITSSCMGGGTCGSYAETGKVVVINPAGMLFGAGSQVDVNSFTASTFDFNGARNLSDMTEAETATYLNGLRNGTAEDTKGVSYAYNRNLNFDAGYTSALAQAGVDLTKIQNGTTQITLNGATFDYLKGGLNLNKSVNILSDNISYTDSVIRTGDNINYGGVNSFGNVNLVTADGINFTYLANGYADNYEATDAERAGVVRKITMNNSNLDPAQAAIQSGNVKIHNLTKTDGSDINISNSIIKGVKLVNKENGDIYIRGQKDVIVDHSRLETDNYMTASNEVLTNSQNGGEIFVGGGNTTIKNSLLYSSGADKNTADGANAGNIRVNAYSGEAKIENTKILAKGDAKIKASDKVTINGSLIQTKNTVDPSLIKHVEISAPNEIAIHNTVIDSQGNINIKSVDGDSKTSGNIKISADSAGKSIILAGDKLSIQGANTTLDNATLTYDEIKFYNDGTTGTNNVLAQNGTTFSQINTTSGKVGDITTLETNGNFILDKTSGQRATIKLEYEREDDGETLKDDGTIDAISYTAGIKAVANTGDLSITSTQGEVIARNNSQIATNRTLNLTSKTKNVTVADSSLNAGTDLNLKAEAQDIQITKSTLAGDKVIASAAGKINATGINVQATTSINFNANGDITVNEVTDELRTNNFLTQNGNIDIKSNNENVKLKKTLISAGNDANISAAKEVKFEKASNNIGEFVGAKNDVNINAQNITSENTFIYAEHDTNITAANNVVITSDYMETEVDDGNGGTTTELLPAGSVVANNNTNITATGGKLTLKDTPVYGGNDVTIKSHDTITFGDKNTANANIAYTGSERTLIQAGKNITVQSTAGDINLEKTTTPEMLYGGRLVLNAAGNNNITSNDSLKSVNVDYIAGGSNNITTKGDMQFVNSSLKAPVNNLTTTEEGGDVIMNNLTIKVATANAKDTKTYINAKGDVTTKDVTKTAAADAAAQNHLYPSSVEYKADGTAQDGILDINQTKLVIKTKTQITDPKNTTKGSITLDIKNATNKEAGIELTAENTRWDGQVDANEGPEVHLNAVDDKIAISKIVTDKLFLDASDKFDAAPVVLTDAEKAGFPDGTPSKGYIEVRDYMGFNMDNDFTKNPDDFEYKGDYVPGKHQTPDGEIDIYKKHIINFNDDADDRFLLVYDRPTGECPPVPPIKDKTDEPIIMPDPDSLINTIKLPRETVEVSKTSKVSDNTVDQTSNIMSAAAKVELAGEADMNEDDDNYESEIEE